MENNCTIGDPVFSIQLSDDCMKLFRTDRNSFLNYLSSELMDHPGTIGKMVRPFCNDIREELQDDSINIEPCGIEVDDEGKGTVFISWLGFVNRGCSAISGSPYHDNDFRFLIDLNSGVLTFYVDYSPEREPDEF